MSRQLISERFRTVRQRGEFLVGAAVGSGLFAEAAERGGADFVLALSAGRFRLMGAASVACMLPICDSNSFVESFGPSEFIGRCSIPVFFGASTMTADKSVQSIAESIAEMGFAGVMNFPTAVHFPKDVQNAMDFNHFGFGRELELLAVAQQLGLWTIAHVRTRDQARRAAAIGADMICFNYGWNTGGRRGMTTKITLKEAAMLAREVSKVIRQENPEAFLVLEGGPIENTEDLMPIYRAAKISGYIGGSTIDRLPLEDAVINQTVRFKGAAAATRQHVEKQRSLVKFGKAIGFSGSSQCMLDFYRTLKQLSQSSPELPLIINGERGSGRQSTAESLFRLWGVKADQIITLDSSDMSGQRLMIALFGHVGTGNKKRPLEGTIARSDVSGLIIRGLEQVSLHTQRRIARFLSRGKFRPIGSRLEKQGHLNMVFIASTSVSTMIETGVLCPELAELLESREVGVPAVREHVEDLEEILSDTIMLLSDKPDLKYKLSPSALRRLQTHDWLGNLHELRTFAMRLLTANIDEDVDEAMASLLLVADSNLHPRPSSERDVILDALWRHGFHRSRTASFLGISRKTLFNKIRHYNLVG